MEPTLKERFDQEVNTHAVMIYMKGTKDAPQCGFSNQVVQIFKVLGGDFETVDVLADEQVRQGIKEYTQWPTVPQVYVGGAFLGGCDIVTEMYQKGELQTLVDKAREKRAHG